MTVVPPLSAAGWCAYLPNIDIGHELAQVGLPASGLWTHRQPAAPDAAQILGRKGLLAKGPATRLALCAVHTALGWERGRPAASSVDAETAVVACSQLSNADSVAEVSKVVQHEGARYVSVLDAPNVSGNVLATAVALRFGFGGPCLMFTSGRECGAHALDAARLLLAAGRARRVVLVGAETGAGVAGRIWTGGHDTALPSAAGCVVLESMPGPVGGNGPALYSSAVPRPMLAALPGERLWGDERGAGLVVRLALALHLAVDERLGEVGVDAGLLVRSAVPTSVVSG